MSQYDDIAEQYQNTTEGEISRMYIDDPNMIEKIGEVAGLDILGVGCGNGYLERILKKAGASHVVGIDLSENMLALAREAEEIETLGIEYLHHDLAEMPKIGEFDIVTAKYVLNYATDFDELLNMLSKIHRNLKPGGELVALVPNYDFCLPVDPKYGVTAMPLQLPLNEGDKIKVRLQSQAGNVEFLTTYWRWGSYNRALRHAGFQQGWCYHLHPSSKGIRHYGKKFWQDWEGHPFSRIFRATK